VPSLVAAARGADVTATDWAADAIDLLERNAERNGLQVRAEVRDWREPWDAGFDLALAADVLYEHRNVEPLALLLPQLAPETLLGLAGRPHERGLLDRLPGEPVAERVVRLRPATAA
jgi:predicted nicotinamide N-methyase